MLRLAHIINPVVVPETSDLFTAQPVTFRSMEQARWFAQGQVSVQLFSAQYPEDRTIIPQSFTCTPDLDRSVLDIGSFQRQRKLPILRDILERLYVDAPQADYLIYSNVDIGLLPGFYLTVAELISQSYDAFVINRRTITDRYQTPEELPLMYPEIGKPHPGHDCLIFKRDLMPSFYLTDACIGAERIGKTLILNMLCNATRFKEFKDLHLTFHIGDDQSWKSLDYFDFDAHNNRELRKIYDHYRRQGRLPDHPLIQHCTPWADDQVKITNRIYRRKLKSNRNFVMKLVTAMLFRTPLLKQMMISRWKRELEQIEA